MSDIGQEEEGTTSGYDDGEIDYSTIAFCGKDPPFPFSPDQRLLPSASVEELTARAANGDAKACYDLGLLAYERALPPAGEDQQNAEVDGMCEAGRWFIQASDKGLGEGKFAVGCIRMTVVGLRSIFDAKAWFGGAVALGHQRSKVALEWIDGNYSVVTEILRR